MARNAGDTVRIVFTALVLFGVSLFAFPVSADADVVKGFNTQNTTDTALSSSAYKKFRFSLSEETSFKSFIIGVWLPSGSEDCFSIWNQSWTTRYYSDASGDDDYGDSNPGEYSHCTFTGTAENGATLVSGVLTLPAGDYVMQLYQNPGAVSGKGNSSDLDPDASFGSGTNASSSFTAWSGMPEILYSFCDTDVCAFGEPEFASAIETVTPFDGASFATTTATTTGATGYINPDDFNTMARVVQLAIPNGSFANPTAGAYTGFQVIYPISSSGDFSVSTTTSLVAEGRYIMTTTLEVPRFVVGGVDICFGFCNRTLDTVNSSFNNGADTYLDLVGDEISSTTASVLASVPSASLDKCNPMGAFDIGSCLLALVVPSNAGIKNSFDNFRENVLSVFPLGYVTRFVEIMLDDTPVALPAIDYTFGTNSPQQLQGENIYIDIFAEENFALLDQVQADTTGDTLWDVVLPFVNVLVGVAVLLVILHDLSILQLGDSSSVTGDYLTAEEKRKLNNPVPLRKEPNREYGRMNDEFRRRMRDG